MKRSKLAQEIKTNSEQFFKKNPEIAKALRLFDVSYERYKIATEQGYFYTDISTSPSKSAVDTYMGGAEHHKVRLDINAVRGLHLNHYGEGDNAGELLLPHNSKFSVRGTKKEGDTIVVMLEQVRRGK